MIAGVVIAAEIRKARLIPCVNAIWAATGITVPIITNLLMICSGGTVLIIRGDALSTSKGVLMEADRGYTKIIVFHVVQYCCNKQDNTMNSHLPMVRIMKTRDFLDMGIVPTCHKAKTSFIPGVSLECPHTRRAA